MATASSTRAPSHGTRNSILVLVILAGAAWAGSPWWWPVARAWLPGENSSAKVKKEESEHKELTMLELTDEARKTLNIEVGVLKPTTYQRVIPVPAKTTIIPGRGRQQIASQASGTVRQIFVGTGDLVSPRQPLFELQLVHDETVKTQVELLDALADREVTSAEVQRLESLEKRTPGAVPGTRLLEKQYELRHLNHVIASRRQMLVLLGLPESAVDDLIASHLEEHRKPLGQGHEDYLDKPLLDSVTIYAPSMPSSIDGETKFLLEKLNVVLGQHVESGEILCQLGDYTRLWIVGEAFERDLGAIRQARDNAWPITVAVERRGEAPLILKNLTIADIAPQVDADAGAAGFYVELKNELREMPSRSGMAERIDWAFRPGQRMELRVPVELILNALRVPVEAVAQDGLNNYVFQVNGNIINRRAVQVLERDHDFVVIAENRFVTTGVQIAMNGAFQLQLALLNKSIDPAAIAHGHAH